MSSSKLDDVMGMYRAYDTLLCQMWTGANIEPEKAIRGFFVFLVEGSIVWEQKFRGKSKLCLSLTGEFRVDSVDFRDIFVFLLCLKPQFLPHN